MPQFVEALHLQDLTTSPVPKLGFFGNENNKVSEDQIFEQDSIEFQRDVDGLINKLTGLTKQASFEYLKVSKFSSPVKEDTFIVAYEDYELKNNNLENDLGNFTIDTFIDVPEVNFCIRGISEIKPSEPLNDEMIIMANSFINNDGSILVLPSEGNDALDSIIEDSELRIKAKLCDCFEAISYINMKKVSDTFAENDYFGENNGNNFSISEHGNTFYTSNSKMNFTILTKEDESSLNEDHDDTDEQELPESF